MKTIWNFGKPVALITATISIISLGLVNLTGYPAISGWDEGVFLEFAYNLTHFGEYATRNGETFQRMMPVGGTGPTLIVPVALALRLGDDSLLAARLVIVGFMFALFITAYLLLQRSAGWGAALLGVLLLLVAGVGSYGTLWLGRQVLAEIPALAFLFGGILAWVASWSGHGWLLALSALLLAATVVTKNQLILVLGPSLAIIVLADLAYFRCLSWSRRLAPLVSVALAFVAWSLLQVWIVGADARAEYLETQRAMTLVSYVQFSTWRVVETLKQFMRGGQLAVVVVGIGYGFYRSLRRTPDRLLALERLILPVMAAAFLSVTILMSLPWPRYLYPALAFAALVGAVALADFASWANRRREPFTRLAGLGLTSTLIVILVAPGILRDLQRIVRSTPPDAVKFAAFLDDDVPANAIVANWEWEIDFYAHHDIVHPPMLLFAALIDQVYYGHASPLLKQPRIPAGADYVVTGPFATETRTFAPDLEERSSTLVRSIGPYALYRLGN